ncbi:MAG: CRISPR-associated endonuclease Cas1 [Planctomycetota bacterium]
MPVAYVTEPGAVVHLKGRTLEVHKEDERLADWELIRLDGLCLTGGTHITQPAMRALMKAGIELVLLATDGRMLGRLTPLNARNAALRMEQYRCYLDAARRLEYALSLVQAKLVNARALLMRYARNHPGADLTGAAAELQAIVEDVARVADLAALMGTEGNAARIYFGVFDRMCRNELRFERRSTRPPRDPVNALLSLGYTFLVNDLTSILGAIGFDPCLGFYHGIESGRPSLALDLAEPFRTGLIDRFILHLVNNRVFAATDFEQRDGGCYLSRSAFKGFVRQYQRIMLRRRIDSITGKRETYRRHLQLQAERFAATLIRGDTPAWFATRD